MATETEAPTHDGGADGALVHLARTMRDPAWIVGSDGTCAYANAPFAEMTGIGHRGAMGLGWLSAMHADEPASKRSQWLTWFARREAFTVEARVRRRDGKYARVEGWAVPLGDGSGRWIITIVEAAQRFRTAADGYHPRPIEDELRASEHRFQSVFHQNPQPATITRLADGRCRDVNAAFLELTGYVRDELIGRSFVDLGLWSRERHEATVAPLKLGEAVRQRDLPCHTKDGRTRLLVTSSELIEVDGVPCVLTVGSDATEQRAAEEALQRSEVQARARAEELSALLDAMPAVVWIADDRGCRRVRGSRAGYELLRMPYGTRMAKDDGRPWPNFRVFHKGMELGPDELALSRAAREGIELRDVEEEIRFDDGDVVHMFGNAIPLREVDGTLRGAIAAFVDVTRIKRAEAALREADRHKDEFLAMLSHELRNPLAPILTAVELMKLKEGPSSRERDVIERQAKHLVGLVEDLLDVSRIARGKIALRKRPIELAPVVAKAVEATSSLFEQKRHRLVREVPASGLLVNADEIRLVQVVSNLLTNAARYTPLGGEVVLMAERDGGEIVLRVRDNGVGIAPELLPRVFDLFVQGTQRPDRAEGGLGLGLALAHRITTLHGGTIEAKSQGRGRGSEIVVRLPLAIAQGMESARSSDPVPLRADRSRRLLLVDDNADAVELLSDALRAAGHEVGVAYDPATALAAVERFVPDVAILDIGLPVMDGYALGEELRQRLGERAPMLVALTGYGHEHDRYRSIEAGFAVHVVKPVDVRCLIELVDALASK